MTPFGRQFTGVSGIFFQFCGFTTKLSLQRHMFKSFLLAKNGRNPRFSSFIIRDSSLLLFSIIRNNMVLCKIEDCGKGEK